MPTGPGVLQVGAGGNGSNISIEDVTHADAGGDALYSWADIAAACVAKGFFAADGVTPAVSRATLIGGYAGISREVYFCLVSVNNGDGVGTAVTILKDSNVDVVFASTKTYIVSLVGVANRTTEFGVELPGGQGKPSSRDGVDIYFGAAPALRGALKLAGCKMRSNGTLVFGPAFLGSGSRVVNCLCEATGVLGIGTSAGEIDYVFNLDMTTTTSGTGGLTTFNVNDAERLVIAAPNTARIINTANRVSARDVILVGASGVTVYDFALNVAAAGPNQMVDWTWSGYAPQNDTVSTAEDQDWRSFGIRAIDPNASGAPRAGLDWRLKDKTGAPVWSGVTDSEGQISFGSGLTANSVMARKRASSTGNDWVDEGPFTLEVNYTSGPNYNPALESYSRTFTWPGRAYAYGRQLDKMFDIVPIGPSTPPTPILVDDVPMAAEGEIRIQVAIPEAA